MFITFEGPEGSGKSSQITLLSAYLQQQGFSIVRTREPGGTAIGEQIRATVHHISNLEMHPITELLLYSASRAQLVAQVVQPALAAGQVVLCDRYADSTIAYQGYGRGLPLEELLNITRVATGGLRPDLTVLLDIDVRQGLARRTDGGEEMNRLDLEQLAFHERVREGYHEMAAAEPQRWVIISAARPLEIVQVELRHLVDERLR